MTNKIPISIRLREFVFSTISKYSKLKPCPVVFCFHSVADNDWLFNVNPRKFESLINELSKTRKIVNLRRMLNESGNKIKDKVSITFDDGYEDVFTEAYPILKKYGIKACVFINNVPDDNGDFGYLDGKKLLNLKQIRMLKRAGWDIGYHTKTHPDLSKLSEKDLNVEITESKKKVERSLGFRLDYFAYPHGEFNKSVLQIVQKAGFKYAFTANGGKYSPKSQPLKVSRVLVDSYVDIENIGVLTSCQGLYFNKFLTKLLRFKDYLK